MQMYVKTNFEMVTTHTVCVLSTSNSLTGTISAIYVSQLLKVETVQLAFFVQHPRTYRQFG